MVKLQFYLRARRHFHDYWGPIVGPAKGRIPVLTRGTADVNVNESKPINDPDGTKTWLNSVSPPFSSKVKLTRYPRQINP